MSTKFVKKEGYTVELEITVSPEVFEKGMQRSYIKNVKRMNIDGFRKGKAPRKFIEKIYGEGIFYEDAVNYVFPEVYKEALEELSIEPVDSPNVDIKEIGEGKDLVLEVKVDVAPDVELGEYKGIKAAKKVYNVTDKEIDNEIERMRDRNARMITVEDRAVENGDTAVIDFEGFVDGTAFEGGKGENFDLVIGSGSFIPGFEEQIIGAKTGDEIEVNVTFPEDYHAEELKGKAALFKVKVNQIKYKELPELDDEFAKDVSEYDTLDELKNSLKVKFEEENANRAKNETENEIVSKLVEDMKVDLPQGMIESRTDSLMRDFEMRLSQQGMSMEMYKQYTGMQDADFRKQFQPQAENAVKSTLALEKVAELENITASDEDLEAKIAEMAKNYQMEVEKINEILRDEDKENLKKDCVIENAIKFLVENAVITEESAEEEKKPAPKKTAAKKSAAKEDGDKEPAKKTTAKKPAAKKTTAKKETKKDAE